MKERTDDINSRNDTPYDYYSSDTSYEDLDNQIEGTDEEVGCGKKGTKKQNEKSCPPNCMKRHIHVRDKKMPTTCRKKRILFVRGFATDIPTKDSVDAYKHIRNYFLGNDRFHVEWFEYSPKDLLTDVYSGLIQRVDLESPDVLIGHSMGGLLVYRYMADRLKCCTDIRSLPTPIFLMAYLQEPPDLLYKVIKLAPSFIRNRIRLPFELGFKASDLWDSGNVLNGSYRITLTRQIYDAVGYQAKSVSELVSTLDQMKAMMIVCRQDVNGGMLTEPALTCLRASDATCLVEIDGKHEAFSSRKNSSLFFEAFDAMLDTIR